MLARSREIAFFSALLWLVHPVQTQAVSYVYQRFASLSCLFFLLSLTAWVAARTSRNRVRWLHFGAAVICALLAMGTKENAGILPLVVILIELLVLHRPGDRRWLPILASVGAFALVAGSTSARVSSG